MMDNKRQNKIIVYAITIFIIFLYIASFFIHSIIDRGKIKDTISTEIDYPDNEVQGEDIDKGDKDEVEDDNKDEEKDPNSGEIVDNKSRIKVMQNGETEWSELKELNIFNNAYFEDKSIIAPGVTGSYNFTVENISEKPCLYDITYKQENPYNINMVYKLKRNGEYISGNEKTWVSYEQLSTENTRLNGVSKDLYTVEWKWEDAENDTEIGKTEGANYKMFIDVYASQVIE